MIDYRKTLLLPLILLIGLGIIIFLWPNESNLTLEFGQTHFIEESGEEDESTSPLWWLDSGAYFYIQDGMGRTNFGILPQEDSWRSLYNRSNPTDTDNGLRPQNIFRLISRPEFQNVRQEMYFNIDSYNLSRSPVRDATNGVLLFSRYIDADNLYYAGIRVDGAAIIKKKVDGVYQTLGQSKILPGAYEREENPNLIPLRSWIGVRSEVVNQPDNSVRLRLFVDLENTGEWTLVLESIDKDSGLSLTASAYVGIRTDFMDITFDRYMAEKI